MIKSSPGKTNDQTRFLCASICGRMLSPSSQKENDEVASILERNGASGTVWIRISDTDKDGVWIDIENNSPINFTNWASEQPRYNHDFAYILYPSSKWYGYPGSDSGKFRTIICELP